jgi:hypothetical protein
MARRSHSRSKADVQPDSPISLMNTCGKAWATLKIFWVAVEKEPRRNGRSRGVEESRTFKNSISVIEYRRGTLPILHTYYYYNNCYTTYYKGRRSYGGHELSFATVMGSDFRFRVHPTRLKSVALAPCAKDNLRSHVASSLMGPESSVDWQAKFGELGGTAHLGSALPRSADQLNVGNRGVQKAP